MFPDITRTIFQRMGYAIKFVFVPWERGLELTKEGDYDGLLIVSYQQDRMDFFNYTDPILIEEGILISQKGRTITYTSLDELAPYIIGGDTWFNVF